VTQSICRPAQRSGLIEAIDVLQGVKASARAVRRPRRGPAQLVQKIVKAYERYSEVIAPIARCR
jgi:hypothetical protein